MPTWPPPPTIVRSAFSMRAPAIAVVLGERSTRALQWWMPRLVASPRRLPHTAPEGGGRLPLLRIARPRKLVGAGRGRITGRAIPVGAPKQNSPGQSRGCFASNRSLALAVLAAALSGLLLAALSGLLALLPGLLLATATLLLTTVLAALSGLLALLTGFLLAAALTTLVGIIHDHSCED